MLAQWLTLSRRATHQLLDDAGVTVNGRVADRSWKGRRLAVGDRVTVTPFERPEDQRAVPEPHQPLEVVSECAGWVIANKPATVPVHPLRPKERGTLLNALIARYPHVQGVGEGGLRSGVVHRLDVTTSGVVVFALTPEWWQRLRRAFAGHAVRKMYQAVVHGRLEGERRDVLPLIVRRHRPARVAVADAAHPAARRCALRWRACETFADATHLEIELETGFLHQIRVMLAHRGHPLVGDPVYGRNAGDSASSPSPKALGDLPVERPMLHAAAVTFAEVSGAAQPPADFTRVLAALRQGGEPGAARLDV